LLLRKYKKENHFPNLRLWFLNYNQVCGIVKIKLFIQMSPLRPYAFDNVIFYTIFWKN
jgi:hypothetical protein